MEQLTKQNAAVNNKTAEELNSKIKEPAKRVYRITPESFSAQIKELSNQDLFKMQVEINDELARRREAAEKLVEELKGGK